MIPIVALADNEIYALVINLQDRYDQQQAKSAVPKGPPGGKGFKRGKERRAEIQLEIDRAMEEIKEWYTLLIQASNYVFQVEYWTRRYDAARLRF